MRSNGHGLIECVELLAEFGKLAGIDGNFAGVFGLGNSEMFDIERDKVQSELGGTLLLGILEDEL